MPAGEVDVNCETSGQATPDKTITAKTELLQGGCLPGDTLQIRISIDHRKPVKTMQGIIITVFRQGRIDTHPALPLGPSEMGGRRQYEDYYPKSRTGLGGLSLSSAGSSRVFRQDLAQTITPMIIDPQTMSANIKTSIQMPDHAFPSITGVPGEMISFRYFVEIVIDLRAKPVAQDRFLPNLSITNGPQHSYGDPKISKIDAVDGVSYSATPGFNYLITDHIRRTKGVVFTTTEIVVGTKDTTRSRGKPRKGSTETDQDGMLGQVQPDGGQQAPITASPVPEQQILPGPDQMARRDSSVSSNLDHPTSVLSPPDLDEPQDEKSQIRRAEERLLPSSPPLEGEPSALTVAPTAPFAHDEEDFIQRYGFGVPAPSYTEPPSFDSKMPDRLSSQLQDSHGAVIPAPTQIVESQSDTQGHESPILPAQEDVPENDDPILAGPPPQSSESIEQGDPSIDSGSITAPSATLPVSPRQDGKLEIERARRQAQVSCPADSPEDGSEAFSSATRPSQNPAPGAPTLEEVELTQTHEDHDHEELPVYRR